MFDLPDPEAAQRPRPQLEAVSVREGRHYGHRRGQDAVDASAVAEWVDVLLGVLGAARRIPFVLGHRLQRPDAVPKGKWQVSVCRRVEGGGRGNVVAE